MPEAVEEVRISSSSLRKAKVHDQQLIAMLYCFVLLAIGLCVTLYCTGRTSAELEHAFIGFFMFLHLTSVAGMLHTLCFVLRNRNATLEAIKHGNLTAPKILFSMRGEPVSLYLRIGLSVFAAMAIVFSVLRAVEVAQTPDVYIRIGIFTATKILFLFTQSLFLLKLHQLVILAHIRLFSFILLHLLTVNLCIWVESVAEKVSRNMISDEERNNHLHRTIPATSYFLPSVPEYCAVAVAVIYEMSQRVGQLKQIEPHHKSTSQRRRLKYHLSFFLGMSLPAIVLAIILALESFGEAIDQFRWLIHLCEMSIIHALSLALTIVGIIRMKKLKFSVSYAKNSLDGKLLLVTFFVTVNFLVVSNAVCIAHLTLGDTDRNQTTYMTAQLASTVLELIQVIAQTYYIHDMFYRCCPHEIYLHTKPGSAILIILSALNFSLWMAYSFQVKHNSMLFQIGKLNCCTRGMRHLHTFITTTLPMVMLYRYHSSVCLAISYRRVYEDEVTRYESMLRWMKQGTTHEFLQNQCNNAENTWTTGYDTAMKSIRTKLGRSSTTVRPRFSSHPMLKLFTTQNNFLGRWSQKPNEVVNRNSSQLIKQQRQPVRRDTRINLEMAKIRVAAIEMGHRMLEMKLKQEKTKATEKGHEETGERYDRRLKKEQSTSTENNIRGMFIVGHDEDDAQEYDNPSVKLCTTPQSRSSNSASGVELMEICSNIRVQIPKLKFNDKRITKISLQV